MTTNLPFSVATHGIESSFLSINHETSENETEMSYPAQDLQPNTLYLTISTPEAPASAIAHIYDVDMTWLQGALAAPMEGADNFEWGIYWHRGHQDGTWYMMHRAGDPELPTYQLGLKMKHPFKSMEMRQSPRLHHHVVGLIRLMRITDLTGPEITTYLDWLAPRAAMKAQRSVMWAMTVYGRTRKHVAKVRGVCELGFDTSGLIREVLQFAHREIWYSLAGQLPRPIFQPPVGVEKETS